jgi:hypothetical protein
VRKHLLTTYRRQNEFQRALRAGHYDYVVVQEISSLDPTLPQRQEKWLKRAGYKQFAEGRQVFAGGPALRVYRAP